MLLSHIDQAFFYYFSRSIRNRLWQMLGRLKNPRYLIGLVAILAYGVFIFKRVGIPTPYFLFAIYLYMFLSAWLFLPFSSRITMARALAFRQAELQQLFSAPLSRRRLLQFKFMQSQWTSLIAAIIFSILTRNVEGVSFIRLLLGILLVSNILNLHNSLVNLLIDYFKRRNLLYMTWVISGACFLAVGLFVYVAIRQAIVGSVDIKDFSSLPVLQPLLYFMGQMLAPALSTSYLEFLKTLWFPLGLLAVHALLFFNLKFPFEDNAITTAEKLADLRKRGWSAFRKKQTIVVKNDKHVRLQRLAATGPQWKALVWKNLLSISRIRPGLIKRLCLYIGIVFVVGLLTPQKYQIVAGVVLAFAAAYTLFLGPALLRVDLRVDIPHFDVIKSMPMDGRQLIFGEIMAPQIVIFAFQVILSIASVFLISQIDDVGITIIDKVQIIVIALPILFSLTFFLLTMQNLMALHLPSLVTLGPNAQRGFDQFGPNIIGALVRAITLLFALVPVVAVIGIICGGLYLLSPLSIRSLAIIAAFVGSIALFLESLLLIFLSDNRYRHFDLSAEKITAIE